MRSMLLFGLILSTGATGALASADDNGGDEKGWKGRVLVIANGGYQTAAQGFAYSHIDDITIAKLTADASVGGKGAATFDVGGAVRLFGNFGVGASYSRVTAHGTASLALNITSPLFDAPLNGSLAGPAQRQESAVHFDAIYMIPVARRVNVTLYAGPSRFHVRQEMVKDAEVGVSGLFFPTSIDVQKLVMDTADEKAWGVNGAVGLDYMFSKRVGVGTLVRYSHAQVKVQNLIQNAITGETTAPKNVNVDLGGFQFTGGLRIRF